MLELRDSRSLRGELQNEGRQRGCCLVARAASAVGGESLAWCPARWARGVCMPQGGDNNLAGALNITTLREPGKAAGWTAGAQIELRWPHKPQTAPRAGMFQASQVGRPTRSRSGACALAVAHGASHPPSMALAARATKPQPLRRPSAPRVEVHHETSSSREDQATCRTSRVWSLTHVTPLAKQGRHQIPAAQQKRTSSKRELFG